MKLTDRMLERALDASVLSGENVQWSIVFGLMNEDEQTRRIMSREIVRAAIEAALDGTP